MLLLRAFNAARISAIKRLMALFMEVTKNLPSCSIELTGSEQQAIEVVFHVINVKVLERVPILRFGIIGKVHCSWVKFERQWYKHNGYLEVIRDSWGVWLSNKPRWWGSASRNLAMNWVGTERIWTCPESFHSLRI